MGRFIPALGVSAALVLAAPFIGQLRSALLSTFPNDYRLIIGGAIAAAIGAAIVFALVRIRERKGLRYGLMVSALVLGTGYARVSATGNPAVDVVERFHFVEYGVITWLFYRAWRYVGDYSVFMLSVLSALLVGVAEEWLQWFIPARIGEIRDVVLNLWAIGCGLLFAVALDPPAAPQAVDVKRVRRRVARLAAVVVLAVAFFIDSVHLGSEINDPKTGLFRSVYSRDALIAHAADRAERWRTNPPLTWSRLSREDQYLTEGVTHVRRRNECWTEQNVRCAWHENLILEEYYAPVLDTPTYISMTPHRWPPEQRADLERREGGHDPAYYSDADEVPIWTWPRPAFWVFTAAALVTLLAL